MDKAKFYKRLKEAYVAFKREICFFMLFLILLIQIFPTVILSTNLSEDTVLNVKISILVFLGLQFINVLFDMYEKVQQDIRRVTIIESNDLLENIYRLVKNENEISIKYITIAGSTGWGDVLCKFLDKADSHCLLAKRKIKIEIATIAESFLCQLGEKGHRYESVSSTVDEIQRSMLRLKNNGYKNVDIQLYRYTHMPNFIGYLVNDNYLFSTLAYWELEDGSENNLVLRGGRRPHIVYDKNDGFGGDYYINKFKGWFRYVVDNQPKIEDVELEKEEKIETVIES